MNNKMDRAQISHQEDKYRGKENLKWEKSWQEDPQCLKKEVLDVEMKTKKMDNFPWTKEKQ